MSKFRHIQRNRGQRSLGKSCDVGNGKRCDSAQIEPILGRVAQLYDTLRPASLAHLGSSGLNSDEANDVIQDAFVWLVRQLADGANLKDLIGQHPAGWLSRMTRTIVMGIYRNAERMPHLSHSDVAQELSAYADPAPNPEQSLLYEQKLAQANQAVSKLSLQQYKCLLLRVEGLCHKQIGSELGVSTRRASNLFREALMTLAEELGPVRAAAGRRRSAIAARAGRQPR